MVIVHSPQQQKNHRQESIAKSAETNLGWGFADDAVFSSNEESRTSRPIKFTSDHDCFGG